MSIYNYEQACRVLGVEISASANEIKSAYRDLAKRLHPDNHPQQTERIREAYRLVVEAYEYTERHPEEKEAFLAVKKNQQNPGGGKILGATDGMRSPISQPIQSSGTRILGSPVGVRTGSVERAKERKQFDEKARMERDARREKMQEDLQERRAQLDQEKKEKAILNEIRAIRLASAIQAMLKEKGIE